MTFSSNLLFCRDLVLDLQFAEIPDFLKNVFMKIGDFWTRIIEELQKISEHLKRKLQKCEKV